MTLSCLLYVLEGLDIWVEGGEMVTTRGASDGQVNTF